MPRKIGSKNTDFVASRAAILALLRDALMGDNPPTSFRGLAVAAAVTIPTLQHYFGNREAVLAAVFADCYAGAARQLAIAARPSGLFRQSIEALVTHVGDGFRYGGLDRLHSIGLTEGLNHVALANAYLQHILEPTLQAAEQRLAGHIANGEMRATTNPRHAAISLLSPIILIYLHQNRLHGASAYPTDIDCFLADHVTAFIGFYACDATL